jgi:hypothetical protein
VGCYSSEAALSETPVEKVKFGEADEPPNQRRLLLQATESNIQVATAGSAGNALWWQRDW